MDNLQSLSLREKARSMTFSGLSTIHFFLNVMRPGYLMHRGPAHMSKPEFSQIEAPLSVSRARRVPAAGSRPERSSVSIVPGTFRAVVVAFLRTGHPAAGLPLVTLRHALPRPPTTTSTPPSRYPHP